MQHTRRLTAPSNDRQVSAKVTPCLLLVVGRRKCNRFCGYSVCLHFGYSGFNNDIEHH